MGDVVRGSEIAFDLEPEVTVELGVLELLPLLGSERVCGELVIGIWLLTVDVILVVGAELFHDVFREHRGEPGCC